MRVGEVAERAGVNVETLRYYERRGLLPAPERTPSGHRRYDQETVRFLGAIKEAQAVGFTLAEIAEYLRAARRSVGRRRRCGCGWRRRSTRSTARIAALRRMRDELARVVGCACVSLDHCTCGAAYLARRGGAPAARPSLLHITNGESAGNTLRQTALGGAVLSWQDVLHEGPVPALPRQKLLRTRARFLADCGWGRRQALLSSLERRDRQLLEALRDNLQVVLWFEHDLYDQLQLLDVLALAHTEQAAPELIVDRLLPRQAVLRRSGRADGERARDALALPPPRGTGRARIRPRAPGPPSRPRSRRHWPSGRRVRREQLPFVAPALRRLLEELPAPADGLSGTERRALQAVAAGARTPPAAFVAAQRLEEAPFIGDTWFYRALSALGQGTTRLLETETAQPLPPPPPLGDSQPFARLQLRLTATGEHSTARRSRPSRAPRHRPLDRRHPHHARQHLAMGRRRARRSFDLRELLSRRRGGRRGHRWPRLRRERVQPRAAQRAGGGGMHGARSATSGSARPMKPATSPS